MELPVPKNIVQGSPEWFQARLGKVTASRVADVITRTKTGWGAGRANYMAELLCERLTGLPTINFVNDAMQWGIEKESTARDAYAQRMNAIVEPIGFIPHPRIPMAGASPDGLVYGLGLLEIKCPNTATHIETLLSNTVPARYIAQMQWQMSCVEIEGGDFVSYDPRMPEPMRLFVKRVPRDDDMIAMLEKKVIAFLEELDAKLCALRSAYDLTTCLKESA